MIVLNIRPNLAQLINGECCSVAGSVPLFKRIHLTVDGLDPLSDDEALTIELDQHEPLRGQYTVKTDVIAEVTAYAARRGADGESVHIAARETI